MVTNFSKACLNVLMGLSLGLAFMAAPAMATSVVDDKEVDGYLEKTKSSSEKLTLQLDEKTLSVASGIWGKRTLPFDYIRITQLDPSNRTVVLNFFSGDVLVDEKELKFAKMYVSQVKDGEVRGYSLAFEWSQETLFTKKDSLVLYLSLADNQLTGAKLHLIERYYALPMMIYNTSLAADFNLSN